MESLSFLEQMVLEDPMGMRLCHQYLSDILAYSPGVAYPCKEIEKNPDAAFSYTSKGNLVAVISNGTAVLG